MIRKDLVERSINSRYTGNMARIPRETITKAIALRKQGYSYEEIHQITGIAQGTCSYYLANITLDAAAQDTLNNKRNKGRCVGIAAIKQKRTDRKKKMQARAKKVVQTIQLTKEQAKIYAALLYWAEGGKTRNKIQFSNSSGSMVRTFLTLLRFGYAINESKLSLIIHLHEYHNEETLKKYWFAITDIPISQFNRSYRKPNTGKRKREGYKGCVHIYYSDIKLWEEFQAIWKLFPSQIEKLSGKMHAGIQLSESI